MITITPELSEICGIHAGDGYLRGPIKRVELDISGNTEERGYYDSHVKMLFEKVFGISVSCKLFSSRNTYGFVVRDRKITEFMHELGFPYGNKSTIVRVPQLIRDSSNKEIISSFLRGYFDTDGCLFLLKRNGGKYGAFKKTHHYYPRIRFSTVSITLQKEIIELLCKMGFASICKETYHPKNKGDSTRYCIALNGYDNVHKFFNEVSSKNPVKLSRFLVWKKFGHCPAHTTLNQREEMLKSIKI